MRKINFNIVRDTVSDLVIKANTVLRTDVLGMLKRAYKNERSARAKRALRNIIENADIAQKEKLAICQDTGLPIVFVEIGRDVIVAGKGIAQAIQQGIQLGYKKGSLRNSIINDPLRAKKQASRFGPALIHYDYTSSRKLKITVLPKGFGCENKSQLKMFLPTTPIRDIKDFIVDAVKVAGPDACPPYVIGVGIGGSTDYACLLAKKALLKPLTRNKSAFERSLLHDINCLNIGPMGLGGKTTALTVNVTTHPTHIAGLPVAVNISCHALRSASVCI